jgi:hypothetical protein
MWFWSAGHKDPKWNAMAVDGGCYQTQYFSLDIVALAFIQAINKKNRRCSILE